jgi:hypothetical protein
MIIVNVDDRGEYYEGAAFLHEADPTIPGAAATFKVPKKDRAFQVRTNIILPIDPRTGLVATPESIKALNPEVVFSTYADVTGSWDDVSLTLSWTTDAGANGSSVLPKSRAGEPSELVAPAKGWEEYKAYVAGLEGQRHLFRGQNKPWRLRTGFHRRGRADLIRFLSEDIPSLHRRLSASTRHVFNLLIPDENGAFLNLAQHHGYPTPLLCWTYSPYVAAFFAYRGISNADAAKADANQKVRILVFDQAQWRADLPQPLHLLSYWPYVSIGEFLATENERMIPQQAASTLSNMDDIETYIRSKEGAGKKYLIAIDLPVRDRPRVIRELGYMGITAGSLFPGLDGACEDLRERNFPT